MKYLILELTKEQHKMIKQLAAKKEVTMKELILKLVEKESKDEWFGCFKDDETNIW